MVYSFKNDGVGVLKCSNYDARKNYKIFQFSTYSLFSRLMVHRAHNLIFFFFDAVALCPRKYCRAKNLIDDPINYQKLKTKWKNIKFSAKMKASLQKAKLKKTGGRSTDVGTSLPSTSRGLLSIESHDSQPLQNYQLDDGKVKINFRYLCKWFYDNPEAKIIS